MSLICALVVRKLAARYIGRGKSWPFWRSKL